jgi:hypothetical protein
MRTNVFTGIIGMLLLVFGCTAPSLQPPGVTARDWMNDYMKSPDGSVWQVQASWNKDGQILFQERLFTGEQFRARLVEDGIGKGTAVRIAVEPGATVPTDEWRAFREAGFSSIAFLTPNPEHWLKES